MPRSRLPVATWRQPRPGGWRGARMVPLVLCRAGGSRGALQEHEAVTIARAPSGRRHDRSGRDRRACAPPPPPPPPPPPWAASTRTTRPATSPPTSGARRASTPPIWTPSSASASDLCSAGTTSTSTRSGGTAGSGSSRTPSSTTPARRRASTGSGFAHNAALVQSGTCFTLYHRGSVAQPSSFEPGAGEVGPRAAGGGRSAASWRAAAAGLLGGDGEGPGRAAAGRRAALAPGADLARPRTTPTT